MSRGDASGDQEVRGGRAAFSGTEGGVGAGGRLGFPPVSPCLGVAFNPVLGRLLPVELLAFFLRDMRLMLLDFPKLHLSIDPHFFGSPLLSDSPLPGVEGLLDGDFAVALALEEYSAGVDRANLGGPEAGQQRGDF